MTVKRLSKRVATGLGLTAILASASFATINLTATGASADPSSLKIRACLDSGGLVNVQMRDPDAGSSMTTYQVSLTGPSRDTTLYPDGGGPTLMQVGSDTVAAKLSVQPNPDDVVKVVTTTVPSTAVTSTQITGPCSSYTSVDFPSVPPDVDATQNCNGSAGAVNVTLQNNMYPTDSYQRATGMDSVNYTVVLVNHDTGELATPVGWLAQFDTKASSTKCLYAPSGAATTYDVRAIAVNGVVKSKSVHVGPVGPPSSPPPVPSPTPTPPVHSTPPPAPGKSTPAAPGASNPAAPSNSSQSGAGSLTGSSGSVTTLPTGLPGPSQSTPATGTSTHGRSPSSPRPSASTSASPNAPLPPSETSITTKRLAEPPLDTASRIFVWQTGPAVIVLADALAISALIGGVVWNGKRR